jgi:spore germination protein GerM
MRQRSPAALVALALLAGAGIWLLFFALPRWYSDPADAPGSAATAADALPERRINATLFYISEDSQHLLGVDREVPYGEGTAEQARRIVLEQLRPPPAPLMSPFPAGTTLRALFLTDQGEAFVDLSGEVAAAHPGGSLYELFTVYSLVNALTVNLPAISAVQVLVDGREVETLTGHVDLRHPLRKSLRWVAEATDDVAF